MRMLGIAILETTLGYTMSEPGNDTIMVVICTDTLKEVHQNEPVIRQQINVTLDHEHYMQLQFCAMDGYPGVDRAPRNSEEEIIVYYEPK